MASIPPYDSAVFRDTTAPKWGDINLEGVVLRKIPAEKKPPSGRNTVLFSAPYQFEWFRAEVLARGTKTAGKAREKPRENRWSRFFCPRPENPRRSNGGPENCVKRKLVFISRSMYSLCGAERSAVRKVKNWGRNCRLSDGCYVYIDCFIASRINII